MRLPKRRLVRVMLYVFSFGVIAVAIDLLLITIYARVHHGPDTTVITAPLLPDGRIDYIAAIDTPFAAGITPADNALLPFLQAHGPKQVLLNASRSAICAAIGLPPVPDDAPHFLDFDDFFKAQHLAPDADKPDIDLLDQHPCAADQPLVAAWLQYDAPYLDLLRQASLRRRYYYPYNVGPRPDVLAGVLLSDLNVARMTTNTFLIRAMLRIQTGDPQGAVDDLLTAHRFAALFNQSPISISHTVANYIDVSAFRAARAIATHLDAPQLGALASALDHLAPLAPVATCYDREERFMGLDMLEYVSRLTPPQAARIFPTFYPEADDRSLHLRYCLPVDYDAHMRAFNAFFDELVAALHQPDYPARHAAIARWRETMASLPFLLRYPTYFTQSGIDRLLGPARSLDAATTQRALTRLSIAIARHKLDTGRYPDSLTTLSPKYLPEIPADLYTLKPFPYHLTPAGYTLTSASPNRTDDAGKADDLDASLP